MKPTWKKVYHSNGRRTVICDSWIADDLRFIQPPQDCVGRYMSKEYLEALRDRLTLYERELSITCSAPDCHEPATWIDCTWSIPHTPINGGRVWCTNHAMCYRAVWQVLPLP